MNKHNERAELILKLNDLVDKYFTREVNPYGSPPFEMYVTEDGEVLQKAAAMLEAQPAEMVRFQGAEAAIKTLEYLGYTYHGGEFWKPPLGKARPLNPLTDDLGERALRGKYGAFLNPFIAFMDAELHANAGKGDRAGWLGMSRETAMLEIYYHLAKLHKAVKNDDLGSIVEHSADVANMSMMLLDIFGGLPVAGEEATNGIKEQP